MKLKIGVIGCGNMGSALVAGLLQDKVSARSIVVWDTQPKRRQALARSLKVRLGRSNPQVVESAQVILLAVKPQQMEAVLKEIRPSLTSQKLLLSIAAGISTRWIEQRVGRGIRVVRAMPNLGALEDAGVAAWSSGRSARRQDGSTTQKILSASACVVEEVPERWMDAVTAVSGSGPAYFFLLMEQMVEAGVKLGLSRKVSERLVVGTALGAAVLAAGSEQTPKQLRKKVTSKGGTTQAALTAFHRGQLEKTLKQGIQAAAKRAKELGR